MKRDNVNYLMVGGFVTVMTIALAVLLFTVSGRSGPTDSYYVVYNNVAALNFRTGVFSRVIASVRSRPLRRSPRPVACSTNSNSV